MISSCKKRYIQPKKPRLTSCQFYRLVASCQQVAKICQFHQVTTCHLQTCYNLLKQLAASLWITSLDNLPATSLLTTCNGFVVNKLSQAMPTHPNIWLLITTYLLKLARLYWVFWFHPCSLWTVFVSRN